MDNFTFDQVNHIYKLNGIKIPSVSEIVASTGLADYSSVPKHIMDTAINYGHCVHKMLELEDRGTLDIKTVDKALLPDLEGARKFKSDYGLFVISIEKGLYSKKYGYCGRLDRTAGITKTKYDGKIAIIDYKTKTSIDAACDLQIDGYFHLWNENNPKQKAKVKLIVQLTQDGNYKIFDSTLPENNNIFLSAIHLYNWKKLKGVIK